MQYADDTLLFLPGDARTLFNLKGLLRSFSDSTGLHVNFSKSFLVPINMSEEKIVHLANTFGCQFGSMPFTYFGLPLGTTKPTILEFTPMLNKIEKRLCGISKLLFYNGRLILVNSFSQPYQLFTRVALSFLPRLSSKLTSIESTVFGVMVI